MSGGPGGQAGSGVLLSIVLTSFRYRVGGHFTRTMIELGDQVDRLVAQGMHPGMIEILALVDNQERSIGLKLAQLQGLARGRYITMVGDDDEIDPGYVEALFGVLMGCEGWPDAVTFGVEFWEVRDGERHFRGTLDEAVGNRIEDRLSQDPPVVVRPITQLAAIRREIHGAVPFADSWYGEDVDWQRRAAESGLIQKVIHVPGVLYRFLYDGTNPWGADWKRERGRK